MKKDLFEEMRQKVGCHYISDLPSFKGDVQTAILMNTVCLKDYPEKEAAEFIKYVFGEEEAGCYYEKYMKK